MRAVFDTSVFVAREQRALTTEPGLLGCVSAITIEELALGVAVALDPDVKAVRSHTLLAVEDTRSPSSRRTSASSPMTTST